MKALVYINWGRLVAECPSPGCGDARAVELGQRSATCCVGDGITSRCPGHTFDLEWPENMAQILAALDERTAEKRKNWFPKGHPLAVATGQPHGQSARELREEAAAGEEADAQYLSDRRAQILAELREADIPLADVLAALKGS